MRAARVNKSACLGAAKTPSRLGRQLGLAPPPPLPRAGPAAAEGTRAALRERREPRRQPRASGKEAPARRSARGASVSEVNIAVWWLIKISD